MPYPGSEEKRFKDDQNNQFKLEFVTIKNDHNVINVTEESFRSRLYEFN